MKAHKADCLAMYTHHKSLLDKIFKVSVTRSMAIHTALPLLIMHESDFIEEPVLAATKKVVVMKMKPEYHVD